MENFFNWLLFGVYPYIALAILAVGSVIRYDREPYSWRAGSSQLLRRKQLMWGSVLFHLGVLAIFGGHVVACSPRSGYGRCWASRTAPSRWWPLCWAASPASWVLSGRAC